MTKSSVETTGAQRKGNAVCQWCDSLFKSKRKLKAHISDAHRDKLANNADADDADDPDTSSPDTPSPDTPSPDTPSPDADTSQSQPRREPAPQRPQPPQYRWKPDRELRKYITDDKTVLAQSGKDYYRLAYPQAPLKPEEQRTMRPKWVPFWIWPAFDWQHFGGFGGYLFKRPQDHDVQHTLKAYMNDGAVIIDFDDKRQIDRYDPRLELIQTRATPKRMSTPRFPSLPAASRASQPSQSSDEKKETVQNDYSYEEMDSDSMDEENICDDCLDDCFEDDFDDDDWADDCHSDF